MSERLTAGDLDRLDDVDPENEFTLLEDTAGDAGLDWHGPPPVGRRWFNPTTGGHLSAVVWGPGPPQVVFVHDAGRSARQWDAVILALGLPAASLDLPGHGRSNWRRDGRYEPARLAAAVGEAIASFAPHARLVAGSGLGGLTALAVAARRPKLVRRLVLLDTLPGAGRARRRVAGDAPASRTDAIRQLASTFLPDAQGLRGAGSPSGVQGRSAAGGLRGAEGFLWREVLFGTVGEPDGSWAWRHDPAVAAASYDPSPLWEHLAGAAPTVVHGAGWLSSDDLDVLARRAPRARIVAVDGGDSDLETQQPVVLTAHLLDVLAAAQTSTAPAGTDATTLTNGQGART
ncbi:alpha/beta fold hydrolase [Protofrankia symbiont of Coriaria ruscifolia]|uniref:AB hydrolase-1 domain-containing protein n=1 Tax=Candidatus Protofrankia californiensis TaxID=1839754 RepID=A0A1C3PGB3_9ACTN|nr:alpha/beta hydrolase [Protofrankia symbiont of Coriaria ruscifolia]SBW28893.1 hypothetical protein FDG2_6150 [Candidatus Protofrankia californiensis]